MSPSGPTLLDMKEETPIDNRKENLETCPLAWVDVDLNNNCTEPPLEQIQKIEQAHSESGKKLTGSSHKDHAICTRLPVSNRAMVKNAIEYSVFGSGWWFNYQDKQRKLAWEVLDAIKTSGQRHFKILFKSGDENSGVKLQYLGLYYFKPEIGGVVRITTNSIGPKQVKDDMIDAYYTYDSRRRCFDKLDDNAMALKNLIVDAFTIRASVWSKRESLAKSK